MVKFKRWLKHAFMPPWAWRISFPAAVLGEIEQAVKQSERRHRGELRFAIENALAPGWVWHGMTARHRAGQIFSQLRVWDTEENNGVLIYINLADHAVEILADRAIAKLVPQSIWQTIAGLMEGEFKNGRFAQGSVQAIDAITLLLEQHFSTDGENQNELPNRPVIIRR
jgi:uncharacterized membrane protein